MTFPELCADCVSSFWIACVGLSSMALVEVNSSFAVPSHTAICAESGMYSLRKKKSKQAMALSLAACSPKITKSQNTNLGTQPVSEKILEMHSDTVEPLASTVTVEVAAPPDVLPCGTAICVERVKVSPSLSTPAARMTAVF